MGAGRIGSAYARMMVEGHKCDLLYFDPYPNKFLEEYIRQVLGTALILQTGRRCIDTVCRCTAAWDCRIWCACLCLAAVCVQ